MAMSLTDEAGRRLYLTAAERKAFGKAANKFSPEIEALCLTLLHSGCRISEALGLIRDRVDHSGGLLIFETLKKRRQGVYRSVPVPASLLESLMPFG